VLPFLSAAPDFCKTLLLHENRFLESVFVRFVFTALGPHLGYPKTVVLRVLIGTFRFLPILHLLERGS